MSRLSTLDSTYVAGITNIMCITYKFNGSNVITGGIMLVVKETTIVA